MKSRKTDGAALAAEHMFLSVVVLCRLQTPDCSWKETAFQTDPVAFVGLGPHSCQPDYLPIIAISFSRLDLNSQYPQLLLMAVVLENGKRNQLPR